jgi:uncharacterized protein YndB with AHSA1/START domain
MPTADTATHNLSLTRRFHAPCERVFAAFTTFDALKSWLGPGECGIVRGEMDFRVGGTYRMDMKTPHGPLVLRGAWREITPPERIVLTWQWFESVDGKDEADGPETLLTFEFAAIGAETEVRLTQTGLASAESRDSHEYGWNGSFDRLATLLSA